MSKDPNSLAHTTWNCKYHIVFAPKYKRQVIYEKIKKDIRKLLLSSRSSLDIMKPNKETFFNDEAYNSYLKMKTRKFKDALINK